MKLKRNNHTLIFFSDEELVLTNTTGKIHCFFNKGEILELDVANHDHMQFYSPTHDLYFIFSDEQYESLFTHFMEESEYRKWIRKQKLDEINERG